MYKIVLLTFQALKVMHNFTLTTGSRARHCNLSEHLDCFIPAQMNSSETCECPDACESVRYEAESSLSWIPFRKLDALLSDNAAKIHHDYRTVQNMQHRVQQGLFFQQFIQINKVILNCISLTYTLKNYAKVSTKIVSALENIQHLTANDSHDMAKYFRDDTTCREMAFGDCNNKLMALDTSVKTFDTQLINHKQIKPIQNWYSMWMSKMEENAFKLDEFHGYLNNKEQPFSLQPLKNILTTMRVDLQQNFIRKMASAFDDIKKSTLNIYAQFINHTESCMCSNRFLWRSYVGKLNFMKRPLYNFDEERVHYTEDGDKILAELDNARLGQDLQFYLEQVITGYTLPLHSQLDHYWAAFENAENNLTTSIEHFTETMEQQKEKAALDANFLR